jgi:N-ethylmaleimide reductase
MVSPWSQGYLNCPGIYDAEQVEGWRPVTDAVHQQGGHIFLRLWHCGRISHPSLQPEGVLPVAPSAIAAPGELHTPAGKQAMIAPRALEISEIQTIVEEFRTAARNALEAGFDGIELHGAFGYLIDQFLQDGSNQRTDEYGGSIENRTRFLLEVVEAVSSVWGSHRVGVKLSPSNTMYGMSDSDPLSTFRSAITALSRLKIAYVHLMEPNEHDLATGNVLNPVAPVFRADFDGSIVANGGYDKAKATQLLANDQADLVSFGRLFLANPDLPKRLELDAPLNQPNPKTFYGRGEIEPELGYTDYPCWKFSVNKPQLAET